jgi:hypothetical protein
MMATWLTASVGACRVAALYPTRDGSTSILVPDDAGFGSVKTAVSADVCPQLVVSAAPADARIGESLHVTAQVVDPDPGAAITFRWSSAAGSFADATIAETDYACPGRDQAGPQRLSVTVSDGACEVTRTLSVACFALADGGGPTSTVDAAGDAGPACVQAGDPTICEGDACNSCTFDNCDTLAAVNARGGVPIAGCDIYVTEAQQQLCQRAYACMRDSHCMQNSDPRRCWCGSADTEACETGAVQANGPCRQAISDAAGSTDPVLIDLRLTDPVFPIGGAVNLATCRSVSCSVLSDPPSPVCRL